MTDSNIARLKRMNPFRSHNASGDRHDATDSKTSPEATAPASTDAVLQPPSVHLEEYFPKHNTLGLRVVHNPEGAQVDIIFIHGLMGDAYNTWMDDTANVYWPVELLGKANDDSRIIVFGYDSQVLGLFSPVGQNTLRGHADSFLGQLGNLAPDSKRTSKRKIILVVHSLGGLVAKKALCVSAQSPHKHLRQLHENIHGVLFLGTPHRGSDLAPNAKRLAKLFKYLGGAAVNPGILEPLLRNSPILEEVENDFGLWLKGKSDFEHITCFYEEFEVPSVGFIVSKESATISGFPGPYSIHSNHMRMAKFGSSDDPGFKQVYGELRRWIDAIEEDVHPVMEHVSASSMLRSLSFPEMDSRSHLVRDTTPGTCSWVYDSPVYNKFLYHGGLLCIKGKPGSGKSTMLRKIITKFQDDSEATGDIVTSFFLWGSGTKLQRSILGFYRSLLHQLCQTMPQLCSDMTREFLDNQSKRGPVGEAWNWNERQLSDTLRDYLGHRPLPRRTWVFLDALDEADEEDAKIIAELLKDLSSAAMRSDKSGSPFLGICFTCRHYPIIRVCTDLQMCVEDQNGTDISTHSRVMLSKWALKSDEMEQLCTFITKKASGVFLWAQLVLDQVDKHHLIKTFRQVQHIIEGTPPELKQMYSERLQSIDERDRAQSLLIFQWICFAQAPLSLDHLKVALLLDSNRPEKTMEQCWSADDYIAKDDLLSNVVLDRTRGLAQISSDGCIQLIHQSVKDFLEDDPGELCIDSGPSNHLLFRSCLKFMSFPEYISASNTQRFANLLANRPTVKIPSLTNPSGSNDLQSAPAPSWASAPSSEEKALKSFTIYVTKYWHHHLAAAERGPLFDDSIICELSTLSDFNIGENWSKNCRTFGIGINFKPNDPLVNFMLFGGHKRISLLHALAACGLLDVLKVAIGKRGLPIEPQEAGAPTLLHCAVACRQEEVTEWLLSLETVDPNKKDSRGKAPLHWLVRPDKLGSNPHPEKAVAILEKFLETPKVDLLVEGDDDSVLHHAAFYGKHDLLRVILKKTNINISLYNKHDWTPLDLALCKEDKQALGMLITAGFEKLQDGTVATATECNAEIPVIHLENDLLNAASTYGMIFSSRIASTSKNYKKDKPEVFGVENTVLHLAARVGNNALCQFLIDLGFKVEVEDMFRRKPLHRAAESGHPSTVKLLLDAGSNVLSRDLYGLGPAHFAIIQGHFGIAQTLAVALEKADFSSVTPFFRAILDGYEEVAYRECLDDAEYHQILGRSLRPTLFQKAVISNDFKMVKASIRRSNIEAADACGPPLFKASERGHLTIAKLLLDHGAQVENADPMTGNTPLHAAAEFNHQELVTLLIRHGAGSNDAVNRQDRRFWSTPLHYAAEHLNECMVRELVGIGADPNMTNLSGETPLHTAAVHDRGGNIVGTLVELGANLNVKNKMGQTPLHAAVEEGCENVVGKLVEIGADVNAKDRQGRRPLHIAVRHGHRVIARELVRHGAKQGPVVPEPLNEQPCSERRFADVLSGETPGGGCLITKMLVTLSIAMAFFVYYF